MRTVKMVTVTLAIETDVEDVGIIEEAICSELAGFEVSYDSTEALPDGSDGEQTLCDLRIAIAKTETCRVDAGVSHDYAHPDAPNAKNVASIGGRQIVYG